MCVCVCFVFMFFLFGCDCIRSTELNDSTDLVLYELNHARIIIKIEKMHTKKNNTHTGSCIGSTQLLTAANKRTAFASVY